jgi:outer membrane protein assembly factor BamB
MDRILKPGVKGPASGFPKPKLAGSERVLCLDDTDGKILWQHEYECTYQVAYPAGPRTTPLVQGGKLYTLGTMGDLLCLNVDDGKVLWSRNFPKDYAAPVPLWGFAAHPVLDGDKLICLVGGKDSLVVAFHKDTGKELWRSQSSDDDQGYCPPMIFEVGGRRQLIIWHPHAVKSLDPQTGKVYWSEPFEVRSNLTIPTPRLVDNLLLVTSFYNGSMMLQLDRHQPAATVLWKGKSHSERPGRTDGLHSIMVTPVLKDGYIYGVCSYGELRCLKADTGERIWMDLRATGSQEQDVDRWANAFITPHGDRYFLFNEKGELIIARLSPKGYKEISRAHILQPTNRMAGRPVVWSHPAFAHQNMYVRNDKEIVSVTLAATNAKAR